MKKCLFYDRDLLLKELLIIDPLELDIDIDIKRYEKQNLQVTNEDIEIGLILIFNTYLLKYFKLINHLGIQKWALALVTKTKNQLNVYRSFNSRTMISKTFRIPPSVLLLLYLWHNGPSRKLERFVGV